MFKLGFLSKRILVRVKLRYIFRVYESTDPILDSHHALRRIHSAHVRIEEKMDFL